VVEAELGQTPEEQEKTEQMQRCAGRKHVHHCHLRSLGVSAGVTSNPPTVNNVRPVLHVIDAGLPLCHMACFQTCLSAALCRPMMHCACLSTAIDLASCVNAAWQRMYCVQCFRRICWLCWWCCMLLPLATVTLPAHTADNARCTPRACCTRHGHNA